jgi:hypothetical protein
MDYPPNKFQWFVADAQQLLRPSHQGQEKAEDEKFAHGQMLVRNVVFGIHRAGICGLIYSALLVPTVPPPS